MVFAPMANRILYDMQTMFPSTNLIKLCCEQSRILFQNRVCLFVLIVVFQNSC